MCIRLIPCLVMAILAFIQQAPAYAADNPVFYINGMFNGRANAERQAEAIGAALDNRYAVELLYNSNYFYLDSLLDSFVELQGGQVTPTLATDAFWRYSYGLTTPSQAFLDAVARLNALQNGIGLWSGPDLQRMRERVVGSLSGGRSPVVVAHSQGNFFYRNLLREVDSWNATKARDCLAGVGFGTPLRAGSIDSNYRYITSGNDRVINATRALFPTVLAANIDLPLGLDDMTGHGLLETYLSSPASLGRFSSAMSATFGELQQGCDDCVTPLGTAGGVGESRYVYTVDGNEPREILVQFEAFNVPDALTVSAAGLVLGETQGQVSGYHELLIDHIPALHGDELDITVRAPEAGTRWELCVDCQGNTCEQNGGRFDRLSIEYRLERGRVWSCGPNPVSIDGRPVPASGTVSLTAGAHVFAMEGCYCESSLASVCESGINVPGIVINEAGKPLQGQFLDIYPFPARAIIGQPAGPTE